MLNIEVAPLEECVRDVIEIDLLRPAWMRHASCRTQGFSAWLATDEAGEEADAAREICAACPVRLECLDYALGSRISHGLWGGLSARERSALARRRRRLS